MKDKFPVFLTFNWADWVLLEPVVREPLECFVRSRPYVFVSITVW